MTAPARAAAAVVVCGLALLTAPAAAAGPRLEPGDPDPAAIAAAATAHVGATRLPGVAVAVAREGRVVHVGAYGHDATGAPLTTATPLRLGAVSESFTSVLLSQPAGFADLRYDDPVVAHLPEFTTADPRSARITVRQLLDHTSGLPATHEAADRPPRTLQEAVAGLRDVVLEAEPGTRRERSAPGYWVAARLLEVVAGRPFAEQLHDRVLFPAGLLATRTVDRAAEPVPGLVDGYGRFLGVSTPRPEPDRFVAGSGGVVSTPEDVGAWLAFHSGYGLRTVMAGDGLREVQRIGWADGAPGGGELVLRGRTATSSATLVLLPDTRYGVAVVANSREPLDGAGLGAGAGDVEALADELVALTRGTPPAPPGPPLGFLAELLLVATAVAAGVLAFRGARRARAGRAPRLVPCLLPLVVLAPVAVVGPSELATVWPTALTAAAVVASAGLVVAAARLRAPRLTPRTGR